MKVLKRPTSSFLQGDIDDILELFAKINENKGKGPSPLQSQVIKKSVR